MKSNNATVIEKFTILVDRLLSAKIKKTELDTSFLYQLLLEIQELKQIPGEATKSSNEQMVVSGGEFKN